MDSLSELWTAILKELEKEIPEVVMKTWISPLEPVSFDGETLVLKVDSFKKNIIQNKFLSDIKIAVEKSIGFSVEIILETEEENLFKTGTDIADSSKGLELTFEKFIVAPTNQFAYYAAKTVSQKPGSVHNPLFIYGKSGLGKTHLLKAIHAELSVNRPELNLLYTNGETFMNEMYAHITEKNMREFHNKFRTPDVLLVDDIQFIENKVQMQEEFFYTFEELINQGKQIVLASDRPPKDIKSLEEFFPQGMLVQVNERGTIENFVLKCAERLCGAAQLEIMDQTKLILDKYIEKTKKDNEEIHNELLKYSKGARCTFPGWKCTAPCIFGAKNAMIRKV